MPIICRSLRSSSQRHYCSRRGVSCVKSEVEINSTGRRGTNPGDRGRTRSTPPLIFGSINHHPPPSSPLYHRHAHPHTPTRHPSQFICGDPPSTVAAPQHE
eukprot:GHVU01207634.1.p1 GENE.GHVU01207634.1~~GHVU01207634.1.p1  ORF type:complete len:101 (+),score=7.17 GHVU01207634.1:2-304(+)